MSGRRYYIAVSSEGATGFIYSQYAYATVVKDKVYLINFVARYLNCDYYPAVESLDCRIERENFDLDVLVDQEIKLMSK